LAGWRLERRAGQAATYTAGNEQEINRDG